FFRINSKAAVVDYLLANLRVDAISEEARTIAISFSDYNINKATTIVNAYDTVYLKQTIEKKLKSQEQTLGFIEGQIQKTADKLEEYENYIEQFKKVSGSATPVIEFTTLTGQLSALELKKEEVNNSVASINNILKFVEKEEDTENIYPLMLGIENQQIIKSIDELNDLYKKRKLLKLSQKEITMPYKTVELEISIAKSQLLNYVSETKKFIAEQTAELNRKIGALKGEFNGLPAKETELNRLERFNRLYEKFYISLIEKQVEYQITKAGTVPEFTILSEAYASPVPIYPDVKKVWIFFLLGGIIPIAGYWIIRYYFLNVIYSQKQVENKVKAPILGMIPTFKKKMSVSTLVVDKNPKSAISESLRSIRSNSDFMLSKKSKQMFGVTSTISGEGKTFFAINFAAILASADKKVVILDLDMRKPKIHQGFNVTNTVGISSILSGMANWRDAVKHSTFKNLDYITAGPIPPNPHELLLKKEFDILIESLFEDYDVIMADNPPIGLVTDANTVFKKCDLSIYVVRAGYSKETVIENINSLYKSKNYTNLSVVINDVNRTNTYGGQFGYGSGYGYGYYEDEKNTSRFRRILNLFNKK
ncbi:MAG: polysaccharide biosynthesis tyrosine autokinase, partial [Bacteroidia bacterium]|nr:polysaccharide biosynthesis tyrosine autokinase [Bacteroidia bacterium]